MKPDFSLVQEPRLTPAYPKRLHAGREPAASSQQRWRVTAELEPIKSEITGHPPMTAREKIARLRARFLE